MAGMKSGIDLYRAFSRAGEKSPSKKTGKLPASRASDRPEGLLKITADIKGGKAARLMLLLGADDAARVMAKLTPDEAEDVSRQIASIGQVGEEQARDLLDEFGGHFADVGTGRVGGGAEAARRILTAAFGEEEAARIARKVIPPPKPFAFLRDLPPKLLNRVLQDEPPHTLSLVTACMDPRQASQFLESLPSAERTLLVRRMAALEKMPDSVVAATEDVLRDKVHRLDREENVEVDGCSALADILRHMDSGDENRLLEVLKSASPDLAQQVREKLYTMDVLFHLRERDLQVIFRNMDEKEIALLLKGQPPPIKERVFASISTRRRVLVTEEAEVLGPVLRSEADAAIAQFLEGIRTGVEAGVYTVFRKDADLIS